MKIQKHRINAGIQAKIVLLSDIHYSKSYPVKRFPTIINYLKQNCPDYICISGDLIDEGDVLDNEENSCFLSFMYQLSSIAPVIIGIGNHDMTKKKKKPIYTTLHSLKKELQSYPNIYILDNQVMKIGDITFYGYTLPFSYYYEKPYEDAGKYQKDIDLKFLPYLNHSKYHILLCHSPLYITSKAMMNDPFLKQMNLILCGHMHNGLIPSFLDFLPSNRGMIAPFKSLFPKYARGKVKFQNTSLIISGGILTFSYISPKFFHCLNFLYPSHLDFIILE